MALSGIESLKVREIEREGQFTPIQFADIARGAIGAGQQFEESQENREAKRSQREQAAQMQKLLNGGQNALLQAFGQLDDEDKMQMFGGDINTIKAVTQTPEQLLIGWKKYAEVLARKQAAAATTFGEKAVAFGRGGLISGKEELGFQKPTAGQSGVSREGRLILQKRLIDAANAKGSTLTKAEANQIGQQVSIDTGIPELGESKIIQFAITSGALPEKVIERERFDEQQRNTTNANLAKLGKGLETKSLQGKIFNDLAKELDLFNPNAKSIVSGDEFNLIRAKFTDVTPESIFSALLSEKLGANPKTKEEKKFLREVRRNPETNAILNSSKFASSMTKLAKLINILTKDRSGAAVTPNELERIKTEFGIDLLGSPEQFKIGLMGFGSDLKFAMEQTEASASEKALSLFKKRKGFTSLDLLLGDGQSEVIDTPQTIEVKRSRIEELRRKQAE